METVILKLYFSYKMTEIWQKLDWRYTVMTYFHKNYNKNVG